MKFLNKEITITLISFALNLFISFNLYAQSDDCNINKRRYDAFLNTDGDCSADSLSYYLRKISAICGKGRENELDTKIKNLSKISTLALDGNTGWATIKDAAKFAFIDDNFKIIKFLKSPHSIAYVGYGLFKIEDENKKFGLINKAGNYVTKIDYENIWDFREDSLAGIQKDGMIGVVNSKGKEVIKPKYRNFYNGFATVDTSYDRYGIINHQGRVVTYINFSWCRNLENNWFLIRSRDLKYFFLNPKTSASSIEFDGVEFFKEYSWSGEALPRTGIGKIGYDCFLIDEKGSIIDTIYNKSYELDVSKYREGVLPTQKKFKDGEFRFGFSDRFGKEKISHKYFRAEAFQNGLAAVSKIIYTRNSSAISIASQYNEKEIWGFIDIHGNEIIPFRFEDVFSGFEYGLCAVKLKEKWGFINMKGKMVIDNIYDKASWFSQFEKAEVELDGRKFRIDRRGNEITE